MVALRATVASSGEIVATADLGDPSASVVEPAESALVDGRDPLQDAEAVVTEAEPVCLVVEK